MKRMLVGILLMGVILACGVASAVESTSELSALRQQIEQLVEIQKLHAHIDMQKAQVAMHQEMKDGFAKKEKPFKEQLKDALRNGAVDGVKLLGSLTGSGIRLLVQVGVATMIISFSSGMVWRYMNRECAGNPITLIGTPLWFLIKKTFTIGQAAYPG